MSSTHTSTVKTNARPLGAFTSDWHMKPYTWMAYPELRGDSYRSAGFISQFCVERELDLYVLGDTLDKRDPDSRTVYELLKIIAAQQRVDKRFYFLQGQHEMQRDMPWAFIVPGSHWIDLGRKPFGIGPFTYFAFDYQPPDKLPEALDQIPKGTNILLCHQVWRERMGGQSIAERGCDGSFTDIPHVEMVISGDFHAHKTTNHKGKNGQKLTAVSPGSTYMKTLDEDQAKFFYVLYDDLTLESVRIPTRPVVRSRANTEESLIHHIDYLMAVDKYDPADPNKPIWHVEFRHSIPNAYERLKQAAEGRAFLFERPIEPKQESEAQEEGADQDEHFSPSSLEDFLSLKCEPGSAVHKTAVRLSRSANVKEELKQITSQTIEAADNNNNDDAW